MPQWLVSSTLEEWYCLLRETQGAAALPAIQSGQLKHMPVIETRNFSIKKSVLSNFFR